MRNALLALLSAASLLIAAPVMVMAQPPVPATPVPATPEEPPSGPITGSLSFGLGVTSGNKDTTSFNAGYDFKYDPKTKNVVKSAGLFLYGKTDGELTNEQYALTVRDEYSLTPRVFVFGEARYLHDRFKGIQYLFSPTAGVGYKLVDEEATTLSVSGGLGGVWEKDYGVDLDTSGAVSLDEKFTHKLSASATANQSFSALWNISDFGDALYVFSANLAAALVGRTQLKLELLDTYKTRPPQPGLQSNDVTVLTTIVFKF